MLFGKNSEHGKKICSVLIHKEIATNRLFSLPVLNGVSLLTPIEIQQNPNRGCIPYVLNLKMANRIRVGFELRPLGWEKDQYCQLLQIHVRATCLE